LDAVERRFVEEVGTMNIFFRIHDELVTPALSGSILSGITRDSIIQLAKDWGITVRERSIDIHEVIDAVKSGAVKEMFGSGTAAVVSPVGSVSYRNESFTVHDGNVGEWSQKFYDEIVGIQYGEKQDRFGWVYDLKT
jgi:branched-chain amino acid aminotransferase